MDKEAMKQLILESLSMKLGSGYHGTIKTMLKTNQKLDALNIYQNGDNISPVIYLDSFYSDLEKGASIDNVTDRIIQLYFRMRGDIQNFDATLMTDFNHVKNMLFVQLINRHSNTELLQNVPHSFFLDDFAVVIRCLVKMTSDEHADFLVHDCHMEMWDADQETLLSIAMQNTRKMFGTDIRSMNEVLGELLDSPVEIEDLPPIWVLSNRQKIMGAATALFDDVLKEFAETHGSFYIIFSSVHEALLIPAEWNPDKDVLTEMNQEVNATQVEQDEILGTKAYFYDRKKGFVL